MSVDTIARGLALNIGQAAVSAMAQTWNAAGTLFTAIKMNVTDTASNAGSRLIDLQVGGTTKFYADKGGNVVAAGSVTLTGNGGAIFPGTNGSVALTSHGGSVIHWNSDAYLIRVAAKVVGIRAASSGAGTLSLLRSTVAALPAAATAGDGALAFVSDATATTARSTVAGGGANKVMVMSDGTNWLIVA